ncbi:MAG TPA: S8 family serine peptidase, partial [Candidatus Polarisedimenticolaceae bacterium]|nr:S8 family serine peptidase [Candidatus Polarisedimenticolaceae bacterium]
GAGVIVAVIDTGVDRTHPDLADHIWTNPGEVPGNGIDDDGNGYVDDTWGWDFCFDSPPVAAAHGTQVAGQVAGDGTGGTVTGMAPDAELMSLGIDCDTPSRAWEASDYAIAHGAHVITQSYSWWWTDQPNYEGFRRQTDVELAAGVIHANSAGNNGSSQATYPIPYNVSTPANCPAPWVHPDQTLAGGISSVLAVGDVNWSTDVIAASSSIGPSAWEDIQANTDPAFPHTNPPEYRDYPYENGAEMGLIKPDLSAYGTGTLSTCPGPFYCQFSGTSSATPHVSGTIALMLEANPEATPEELAQALMTTAQHRGSPGKNNVYGAGLLQAFPAVLAVESGVVYSAHAIDDASTGNGDGMFDPGEQVVMQITVESRTDAAIEGLEGILSSTTPGVTIHDHRATYPDLAARGTATSFAPHYSLSVDPGACATVIAFDLELRYAGSVRRSTFELRVGEAQPVTLLDDDFESDLGWTSDPVAATQGFWVRQDPIGVSDDQGRPANPEDDTSPSGTHCWVTGNGELTGRKDENNNDVDGGPVILLSPPFGRTHMLSLTLSYDRWYYDVDSGNRLRVEVSNDGGESWALLENLIFDEGGWSTQTWDLLALLPPTDDMRLRFWAEDDFADDPVEAAVDEVRLQGTWVDCQEWVPPTLDAPNPVGDTLRVAPDPGGHTVLTWQAPPVDEGHDAATLYRIVRAPGPQGPWTEIGSATSTGWVDVDAFGSDDSFYYRVFAENSGGAE